MATKTRKVRMKLAKANEREIANLCNILNDIEQLADDLNKYGFESVDFSEYQVLKRVNNCDPEEMLLKLCREIKSTYWQKILFNCETLLENCADPDSTTLEFNAEILKGFRLIELSENPEYKHLFDQLPKD